MATMMHGGTLTLAGLTALKGVGPQLVQRLARLGITRPEHLLFHLPLRYQDRTQRLPIGTLRGGTEALVEGEVQHAEIVFRRRRTLLAVISDGTGLLTLRFFHFSTQQQQGLARGARVQCYGEARPGAAMLEMVHPEYRVLREGETTVTDSALTPIYPVTEGIAQKTLRKLIEQMLDAPPAAEAWKDWLPKDLRRRFSFPPLNEALRWVHQPPAEQRHAAVDAIQHPARRRLIFEELLAHHLSLRKLRLRQQRQPAPALRADAALEQRFIQRLPFTLTAAQRRVVAEIAHDLAQAHPMQRLVQGDVGSGKTVVAALAALRAVAAGYQVAVMAPTELLAEQHCATFRHWMQPLEVAVEWLSGKVRGAARRESLERLADGTAAIVVGTQALFQETVTFQRLGLVIIDEQHRFGVHQRLALREKGAAAGRYPHQLIMTATPIPRTLAMTAYADLDCSVVDELPPGRTPVDTSVISTQRRDEVIARVSQACRGGRQAYWVCTLIEESEVLQCQAAEAAAVQLQDELRDLRIGLVHGRLQSAQKEQVMRAFKNAELDLLVATTVIEVGVDVPKASLMVIENAERLGLAQLHQLRGRVGRGATQSHCLLLYQPPLSDAAQQRLHTLRETTDGFVIAQRDLELRGPGDVLGTRQTGMLEFRIADLRRDGAMIPHVAAAAEQLLREHPAHADALIERWIGAAVHYRDV